MIRRLGEEKTVADVSAAQPDLSAFGCSDHMEIWLKGIKIAQRIMGLHREYPRDQRL